jgi:uncharacterized protein with von Willebrand factor type A (vWA) domain
VRRTVAILLLVCLPLQWGWALAAVYCKHEASAALQAHFGHHEHSHGHAKSESSIAGASSVIDMGADAATSSDTIGNGLPPAADELQPDVECGVCHLGAAQAAVSSIEHSAVALESEHTAVYEARWAPSPLESFFRPPLTARA